MHSQENLHMAEKMRPAELLVPSAEPDHWSWGLLFQAWLVLFLGVICFALVIYLLSYIPK